jgi:hypothetical protein
MAHGHFLGLGVHDLDVRRMFDRDTLLSSDWYRERLTVKQARDTALWTRHIAALEQFQSAGGELLSDDLCELDRRLEFARAQMARVTAPSYREELRGTIGADPFSGQ